MKKFNTEQLELLKILWKEYKEMEDLLYMKVDELEKIGLTNTGIDIEFFFTDGGCVGIGDIGREYELVQSEQLKNPILEIPRAVVNESLSDDKPVELSD